MSANDDTIVLSPGVGGATTDASNVAVYGTTPNIDRERVVIGGDASRAAVLDLSNEGASYKLPTIDGAVAELLMGILEEQKKQTAALLLILNAFDADGSHVEMHELVSLGDA